MSTSSDHREPSASETVYGDSVVILNPNTTIGYARFSIETRQLDYVYVSPLFRRKGYGRRLLELCEQASGAPLQPQPPITKLGRLFFTGLSRALPNHR
jgi:GNAT superfamily N-acetyltransferase